MKIALINGSPKVKESASGRILQDLNNYLQENDHTIAKHHFSKSELSLNEMEKLGDCDAIVFSFPLYVDGVPSHLLSCLVQLEAFFLANNKKDIMVYTLVNCGFPEGHQNEAAIEIMENWCAKTGLKWGQGVGIGAGGMIISVKNVPSGYGPKKNLGKALENIAANILGGTSEKNIFIAMNFPKLAYKLAAHINWGRSIKSNGLRKKDLFTRK